MSIDVKPKKTQTPVDEPLAIKELTTVLIKHYGLHSGNFDLMIEFKIGVGPMGPDPANLLPGAMLGLSKIGLVSSSTIGPLTVDAAVVNPSKKSTDKK